MIKENPKVLFCINKLGSGSGLGGAERLVVDDINEMLGCGIEVRLLTFKEESSFSLVHELKLDKKYWKTVPFKSLFYISDWIRAYKYIKKEKPDVVFSHLWFSNAIIRIICKIAGVKNVISFEHNIYDNVKTEKMYGLDRFLQKWCRKIVAVSFAVKESLIKHGIKESRIIVVNNGIDVSKYKNVRHSVSNIKEGLSVSKDSFVFLTIGRLIPQKGIDILIQSFSKLSGNPILLITGSGQDEEMLRKMADDLGIKNRVYFFGNRYDIPDILSICDCFVLASRWEGLGIVVLEAMASEKPIIISDFPAGKDMITDNVSGLVVEMENVDSLVKAMDRMMLDVDLRDRLSKSAYEKVQDFSIQNHANKILNL